MLLEEVYLKKFQLNILMAPGTPMMSQVVVMAVNKVNILGM